MRITNTQQKKSKKLNTQIKKFTTMAEVIDNGMHTHEKYASNAKGNAG